MRLFVGNKLIAAAARCCGKFHRNVLTDFEIPLTSLPNFTMYRMLHGHDSDTGRGGGGFSPVRRWHLPDSPACFKPAIIFGSLPQMPA